MFLGQKMKEKIDFEKTPNFAVFWGWGGKGGDLKKMSETKKCPFIQYNIVRENQGCHSSNKKKV